MGLGDGQPHYTFADGWIWSLTGRSAEQQQLAMDLAKYLTQDSYLSQWTQDAGYLPVRRFTATEEADSAVGTVIDAVKPLPSADIMQTLGPLLQEAVLRVLNGEDPEAVARSVIEKLG
jgi:ABC-type glycerol-3-phosphate transport system substrate-binding protein